tara:strand:- start:6545 stop:6877 length:333 start_codon:yes stop_codon:yes gene_type:complete
LKTAREDQLSLEEFGSFFFTVKTETEHPQLLTLLQKNYPGWKAYVNEKEIDIRNCHFNFMSIILPKGKNTILFTYKNSTVTAFFWVSFLTFLFMVSFLLLSCYKNNLPKI